MRGSGAGLGEPFPVLLPISFVEQVKPPNCAMIGDAKLGRWETAGMGEVSPKFVHEAEAATAAPPSSASVPDVPLIALGEQWQEAYHRWQGTHGSSTV